MAQRPASRRSSKARQPDPAPDPAAPPAEETEAASAATPLPPPAPPSTQTTEVPVAPEPAEAPPDPVPAAAASQSTPEEEAEREALLTESELALWDGDRARPERPAIDGIGVEVVLTLGDAVGCALYADGRHVLDLDLGGHPLRKRRSYDEDIGGAARRDLGGKRWSRRVHRALERVRALLRPRTLYIAGDNARRLRGDLPPDTRLLS